MFLNFSIYCPSFVFSCANLYLYLYFSVTYSPRFSFFFISITFPFAPSNVHFLSLSPFSLSFTFQILSNTFTSPSIFIYFPFSLSLLFYLHLTLLVPSSACTVFIFTLPVKSKLICDTVHLKFSICFISFLIIQLLPNSPNLHLLPLQICIFNFLFTVFLAFCTCTIYYFLILLSYHPFRVFQNSSSLA